MNFTDRASGVSAGLRNRAGKTDFRIRKTTMLLPIELPNKHNSFSQLDARDTVISNPHSKIFWPKIFATIRKLTRDYLVAVSILFGFVAFPTIYGQSNQSFNNLYISHCSIQ